MPPRSSGREVRVLVVGPYDPHCGEYTFLAPPLGDRRLAGFEALVRWQRPDGDLVSPGRFMPLAEDTGMVVKVDRAVLRGVCAQIRAWADEFATEPFYVSVNLSGRHVLEPDVAEFVAGVVGEHRLAPERLRLEITETALIGTPATSDTS